MTMLVGLAFSIAVIAIVGAGFATMAGLPALRARLFGLAISAALVGLAAPILISAIIHALDAAIAGVDGLAGSISSIPIWPIVVLGIGYVIAAVALIFRGPRVPTRRREHDTEHQVVRGRQRRRLPPRGEEN